ncbi:MAG: hypothetical protein LUD72_07770, partial [Bacteroidales bacterium]|nr:hypothetical protein [Bacteroidales bacterium]
LGFLVGFDKSNAAFVDALLYYGYIICGAAIVAIIVLLILNGVQGNPKGLVRGLIVVVAIVVVVGLVYLISPGNVPQGYYGADQTVSTLKITDTLLTLTYAFTGVAICAILVAVIVNAVRK